MSDRIKNIKVKNDIVLREEDEGAFLFDPGTGRICYLNEPGITIWKAFSAAVKNDNIIDVICNDYPEISKVKIKEDFMKFTGDLVSLGFVTKEEEIEEDS